MSGQTFNLVVSCCMPECGTLLSIQDGPVAGWTAEVNAGRFGPDLTCPNCGCVKRLNALANGLAPEDRSPPSIDSLSESDGAPNDMITIGGHRFASTQLVVKFGNTLATIISRSASSVVVMVPAGSGTVDVSVSNEFGSRSRGGKLAGAFTYD